MKIFYGTERLVLAFPRVGFVLKFPSFHRVRWLKRHDRTVSQKIVSLLRDTIFIMKRGLVQNRREWETWKEVRDPFLAQTHFSFFGFVNCQSYHRAEKNRKLVSLFFEKMHEVLSSSYEVVAEDGHSWFQVANYSINQDGSLCKVDYGGENDIDVIRHFLPLLKQLRIK